MRWEGIFLTIKDLMYLTGNYNYNSAWKYHQQVRDSLGANKRKLTIREYCIYEGLDFIEIWSALRKNQSMPCFLEQGKNTE